MILRTFIRSLSIPWLLSPRHAASMAMYAYMVKEGKMDLKAEHFEIRKDRGSAQRFVTIEKNGTNPGGRVALHTIEGTLMRNDDYCGEAGMMTMSDRFAEADQNPDYIAHVIRMHTPGGSVEGTEIFANTIANATKPVVVHGEDVFSGGVYLASGADHIMMSGKNAAMGSIGVQVSYMSFKRALEQKGIDKVMLRASTSPDKNRFDWDNLSEEDRSAIQSEMLDPIDQHFMEHVRSHRPNVSEEALTGKEYFAEDAIRLGLADSIGTFEEAATLAASLAAGQSPNHNSNMKIETVKPAADSTTEVTTQVEETVSTQDVDNRVSEMSAIIEAKDVIIASQETVIAQQKTLISQLQGQVEALGQLPSVDPDAAIISPSVDASATVATKEEKPAPTGVLAAIERSRKLTAYRETQNKE